MFASAQVLPYIPCASTHNTHSTNTSHLPCQGFKANYCVCMDKHAWSSLKCTRQSTWRRPSTARATSSSPACNPHDHKKNFKSMPDSKIDDGIINRIQMVRQHWYSSSSLALTNAIGMLTKSIQNRGNNYHLTKQNIMYSGCTQMVIITWYISHEEEQPDNIPYQLSNMQLKIMPLNPNQEVEEILEEPETCLNRPSRKGRPQQGNEGRSSPRRRPAGPTTACMAQEAAASMAVPPRQAGPPHKFHSPTTNK